MASYVKWDNKLHYEVAWKGWSKDEYLYPARDLKRAPEELLKFHWENPHEAGPPKRMDQWLEAFDNETEKGLEDVDEDNEPMTNGEREEWRRKWGREFGV